MTLWRFIQLAKVVGSVVLITFLFFKSQVENPETHIRLEQTLRQLDEQEAILRQSVLRLRTGNLKHYDGLTDSNRAVGTMLDGMMDDLERLKAPGALFYLARTHRRSYDSRQGDIDAFKRKTALLNSSLDYFATAAKLYSDSLKRENIFDIADQGRFASLVNLTLLNAVTGNRAHIAEAKAQINTLRQIVVEGHPKLLHLLRHAEIINSEIADVDDITTRLSADAGDTLYSQFQYAHQSFRQEQEAVAQNYRSALYAFAIFLILVVIAFLVQLTRARNNLVAANRELVLNGKKLKSALSKEKELNELQRQFVSMASHEFRTPLAIVDSAAQRLKRRADSDRLTREDATDRVEKIRAAVQRMTKLMDDTLSAARMADGKIKVDIKECDIMTVLSDVCERQQEINGSHEIVCELAGLPQKMQADAGALEQILSNLLSNAVKYAPDAPSIEVKAYGEGGQVIISVRDYGIGIDKDDLERIGERFFRAKTSTGIAGTGIGINLVRFLVEEHGGRVEVESAVGEGSLFTVILPVDGPVHAEVPNIQAA